MSSDLQPEIREKQPFLRERQAESVDEAPTELPLFMALWKKPWAGVALSATVPGIVLAFLGPFGSFLAPLWMRFAYWVPTMAVGALLGMVLTIAFERVPYFRARPIQRTFALSLAMTAGMTLVAGGSARLVFGPDAVPFSAPFVFYVWLITVLMIFVVGAIRAGAGSKDAMPQNARSEQQDKQGALGMPRPSVLSERLKTGLRNAPILALEAEDHYVRVHTDRGSELILLRLADAIAEMGDVEGARTHRSWWVARTAVKESRRADGRATLTLSNGAEAPVSRNALGELIEKGWL